MSKLCGSSKMLQQECLRAKIGFDITKHDPQQFCCTSRARESWFGIVSLPGRDVEVDDVESAGAGDVFLRGAAVHEEADILAPAPRHAALLYVHLGCVTHLVQQFQRLLEIAPETESQRIGK